MDSQKVDMFMMSSGKFFEAHQSIQVRNQIVDMDESKWPILQSIQFRDPTMMLIVSILAGSLGIDRFLIGDTGLGIGKLLTCGGFGIWAIVDWFLIMGATRQKNLEKIQQTIY